MARRFFRIIVTKARTMMIHAAVHWPEEEEESLWPLAVLHAAYLYNHTPNSETGIAPIEVFTGTLSDHQALWLSHTWGCPVYVLEPRLTTSGGKIPKWQPRSRRALGLDGQYRRLVRTTASRKFARLVSAPDEGRSGGPPRFQREAPTETPHEQQSSSAQPSPRPCCRLQRPTARIVSDERRRSPVSR